MKTFTLGLTLLATATAAGAQSLTPSAARFTDAAIHADHGAYQRQQAAIAAANASGSQPVAGYPLAKAQCWLDVSVHEYSRNDRSAFPDAALAQSVRITEWLAQPQGDNPALQTPLVAGAERLREDLWAAAAVLGEGEGARCAQRQRACAEVELVHAGHEHAQMGWRHAKPYIQMAEDLIAEGRAAAAACVPPAAPSPAVAGPAPQPWARSAVVLFEFDRRDWPGVRAFSAEQLAALLKDIPPGTVTHARVTGHADVSNHTGDASYNLRLAQDRAVAVTAQLRAAGIPAERISTQAQGDTQPVADCRRERPRTPAYEACLLPNRRVEVVLEGGR